MKIIFLDIDEVLCTIRSHVAAGDTSFFMKKLDPIAIGLIDRLLEIEPGSRVVISSSWRENHTREEIEQALRNEGFRGKLHDDWCTPIMYPAIRGEEVRTWLAKHPEVTGYVCIDDTNDYYPDQPLVIPSNVEGFLYKDFLKASEILFGDSLAWFNSRDEILRRSKKQDASPSSPLSNFLIIGPPIKGLE